MNDILKQWYTTLSQSLKLEVLLAGFCGGTISTLILHPLDVIKIRLQVSENHSNIQRDVYTNMRDVVSRVYRNSGIRAFYQGVSPNLVGASFSWGLYFFFYHGMKNASLLDQDKTAKLNISQHLSFAAMSGVLTLSIMNPVWVVKTRMVLQSSKPISRPGSSATYRGLFDGLYKLGSTEGMSGLYRGYVAGLFGVSHGVIQFISYEKMKESYYEYLNIDQSEKLSPIPYIVLSAASKILAVSLTYPYQLIRSRLQDPACKYSGTLDVIKRTMRHEGAVGFYKGIIPNLIRVTPACCITFVCFENIMHFAKGYSS